jgi:hypothetical protein
MEEEPEKLGFVAPPAAAQNGSGSPSAPPEEPFSKLPFGIAPEGAGDEAAARALPNRHLERLRPRKCPAVVVIVVVRPHPLTFR